MNKIQRLSLQVYGKGGDTDKYSDFVEKQCSRLPLE